MTSLLLLFGEILTFENQLLLLILYCRPSLYDKGGQASSKTAVAFLFFLPHDATHKRYTACSVRPSLCHNSQVVTLKWLSIISALERERESSVFWCEISQRHLNIYI